MKNILSEFGFKCPIQNRYKPDISNLYYSKSDQISTNINNQFYEIIDNEIPKNTTDNKESEWKKSTSYDIVKIPSKNQEIPKEENIQLLKMNEQNIQCNPFQSYKLI